MSYGHDVDMLKSAMITGISINGNPKIYDRVIHNGTDPLWTPVNEDTIVGRLIGDTSYITIDTYGQILQDSQSFLTFIEITHFHWRYSTIQMGFVDFNYYNQPFPGAYVDRWVVQIPQFGGGVTWTFFDRQADWVQGVGGPTAPFDGQPLFNFLASRLWLIAVPNYDVTTYPNAFQCINCFWSDNNDYNSLLNQCGYGVEPFHFIITST